MALDLVAGHAAGDRAADRREILAVAATDLVGLLPRRFGEAGRGVATFALPISLPDITVSQIWHPRMDADPGHRWLRGMVYETYRAN